MVVFDRITKLDRRRGTSALLRYVAGQGFTGVFSGPAGRTFVDATGVLQTAGLNVIRDGHFVSGTRTTLIEAARTNLVLQSQTMTNAAWSTVTASLTANATTAPDGTVTAPKFVEDNVASTVHQLLSTADITVANGSRYTSSVFAKAGERTWFQLAEGQGVTAGAYFNLGAGTIGTVAGTGSPTATITAMGNGWYRCTLSFTTVSTAARVRLYLATGDGGAIYQGNGTSGLYVWGAQLELGASASSYILTTTTSVTRAAETWAFPTSNLTPSATTLYAKFYDLGTSKLSSGVVVLGGSSAPRLLLYCDGTNWLAEHQSGAGGNSAVRAVSSIGDLVEIRAVFDYKGSSLIGVSVNGGAETVVGPAVSTAYAAAYAFNTILLNSYSSASQGFSAFVSAKVTLGAKTMAEMQSL